MIKIDQELFVQVCNDSETMLQAAKTLGIHFNTFKRYAEKYGCYKPNQGGKGTIKTREKTLLSLILSNEVPYQTYKLKFRLFDEGLKYNVCEQCGLSEWRGVNLNCELHHKDGNASNHNFDNLEIVCPNCHSQTETFRALNKRNLSADDESH